MGEGRIGLIAGGGGLPAFAAACLAERGASFVTLGFDGISGETEPVDAVVVGETARCAALADEAEVALAEAAVIVVAAAGAGAAAALLDTPKFIAKSNDVYGYPNFVCDTGGSICEVVDPQNPNDPVLNSLSQSTLMVWIKGSDDHTDELVRRFDKAPKPMCYQPAFLTECWDKYLAETGKSPDHVDPDAFVRWTYAAAMAHRTPRYQAMAENWGLTISAKDLSDVKNESDFTDAIASIFPK